MTPTDEEQKQEPNPEITEAEALATAAQFLKGAKGYGAVYKKLCEMWDDAMWREGK
jgi:hypothetical protein